MPNNLDESLRNGKKPTGRKTPGSRTPIDFATKEQNRDAAIQRRDVADVALANAESAVERIEDRVNEKCDELRDRVQSAVHPQNIFAKVFNFPIGEAIDVDFFEELFDSGSSNTPLLESVLEQQSFSDCTGEPINSASAN